MQHMGMSLFNLNILFVLFLTGVSLQGTLENLEIK